MFTAAQLVTATETGLDDWVGPAAIASGLLLLIVALYRRSRATLARKRRAARPGAAD